MELLEAVKKVLEWHDKDAWDNVQREGVISDLREAYEAAQQSVHPTCARCGDTGRAEPTLQYPDGIDCPDCTRG